MGLIGKVTPGLGSGGGAEIFDVALLPPEEYGGRGTIDREYGEVIEAIESGKIVRAYYSENPPSGYSCAVRYYDSNDGIVFTFIEPRSTHGVVVGVALYSAMITSDGTWADFTFEVGDNNA